MKYSTTFPTVEFLRDTHLRKMEANLLTKAVGWKHESEWRVVDYASGFGLRPYPPQLLAEVILGAKISPADRDEILGWVRGRNPQPRVLQAQAKDQAYSLALEEIEV